MADDATSDMEDMDADGIDISDEMMDKLMKAEENLQTNPADYDQHMQYIALLKQTSLKQKLREARKAFCKQFPLSPVLWIEWLSDELEAVQAQDDVTFLLDLFTTAVQDYVSVDLWHQYLAVAQEIDEDVVRGDESGQEKGARLFEAALDACGLHITAGSTLHAQRRAFWQRVVDEAVATGDDGATGAAIEKLRAAWHEQLRTPLADGPDTLAAYKEWEANLPEQHRQEMPGKLEKAHEKAQAAVALRLAYEEAINDDLAADDALLKSYLAYIAYERGSGDKKRLTLLYERALAKFPVTVSLWEQLADHLETTIKNAESVLRCYRRAVRNCPWAGSLWSGWLRALERLAEEGVFHGGLLPTGEPWMDEHEAVYTRALQAGLKGEEDYMQVLLARLDMLRRLSPGAPLSEAFSTATQLMTSYFPQYVDPGLRLPQYWARCEAVLNDDVDAGRSAWQAALQAPALGKLWRAHEAYVAFETAHGDVEHARAHLKSILSRTFSEPQGSALCARAWLRVEREYGSAATLFAAKKRCANIALEDVPSAKGAKKAAAKGAAAPGDRAAAGGKSRAGLGFIAPPPAKRAKTEAQQGEAAAAADDQDGTEQTAAQPPPARPPQPVEANTVFVKHLPVDVTEEQIRKEVFEGIQGVKDVRIGTTPEGVGRGFAYVEMEDAATVQAAITQKDHMLYQGKHLLVAQSKPPGFDKGSAGRGGFAGRGRGMGRGFGRGRGGGGGATAGAPSRGGRGGRGRGAGEHMHRRIALPGAGEGRESTISPIAAVTAMTPRSVMKPSKTAPKSNDDFRKLLG